METVIDFRTFKRDPPAWGYKPRRIVFEATCKYLGISPTHVESIFGVGFHSVMQSNSIELSGGILEKVKRDTAILREQEKIIGKIKNDKSYKSGEINGAVVFYTQLGGQRAVGEMWKQALGFWRWPTAYSATWEMACDELTWAVRSVKVKCNYYVDKNGRIILNYNFSDTLDLRPDWANRSKEYNAICYVLGFLYHDVIGGNDELRVKAAWKTEIN